MSRRGRSRASHRARSRRATAGRWRGSATARDRRRSTSRSPSPSPGRTPPCARPGTLHVGGTREEVAASENAVTQGRLSESPYVLVAQQSLFDDTRAPAGQHTLWTYTHVPADSTADRREAVIRQIERFAPGFPRHDPRRRPRGRPWTWRGTIPTTSAVTSRPVLRAFSQLVRRPVLSPDPWRTPIPGVYLCSASVTPGPGVHGLVGWYAALSALRHEFGTRALPDLSPRSPVRGGTR